ncbi:GGDEF domain-containing protein [Acidovorax sp. Leaf78]|uniref:GGDEF domain-containing protein n=1 Tax=unclassified Acidovorax TaxID=2684926 RepID=UPI0006F35957|nr:diguanylate cyclase [Acidovorax sp. Leaf78]KQO23280.1 deoxyribodipyrimidine photolyase [Acidovorax sp. Leaf78]
MPPDRERLTRMLFDEYIEMYAARDTRLLARFCDSFSGFAGSSDRLVKSRAEWVEVTQQDFTQVPARIGIDMVDLFVQDLGPDLLAATAFFHIHLPIPDALFSRETARKVVLFRREPAATAGQGTEGDWKIAHVSVSIPYGKPHGSEVYPIDDLRQRNSELQALVDERTEALAQANHRLELLSNTDGLTGIANRRHFDDALAREWARAQRARTPLALIMLDVDVFKHFNDHYGHLAGDACLKALALTLVQTGARREGELAARFGGEEFVVLLPGSDLKAAADVARHIQEAIVQLALPHEGAPHGIVTVSFGVASLQPQREQLPEELVRQADRALYRAKQGGRNRIELAQVLGEGSGRGEVDL